MERDLAFFSGSSNRALSYRLANVLEVERRLIDIRRFPDNEKYVRIASPVGGRTVILLQSMAFNPDEYLLESCLIAAALKEGGARKVVAAIPYLAYARQDEKFKEGEAISIELITKILRNSGIDAMITVDAHRHRIIDFKSVFGGPSLDVSAMPVLSKYMADNGLADKDTVIIGPDSEAEPWAEKSAKKESATEPT